MEHKEPSRPLPGLPLDLDKLTGKDKTANDRQVGGDHYHRYGSLQPWDVIDHFKLDYFTGNAVKYLLRWRHKGGVEDIRKALHYMEKLLETLKKEGGTTGTASPKDYFNPNSR